MLARSPRSASRLRRSSPRAFTLLEMMLVVVIMGVLIGVSSVAILGRGKEAKVRATRASMATTASMLKNYNLEQGAYPPTLDLLVPKYMEKAPMDAWNRALIYIPGNTSSGGVSRPFTLYSTGESGQQGDSQEAIDYWDDGSQPRQ